MRQISYHVSGLDMVALEWGPENGPLALCLHGYPDTAWSWRHLGPHLAESGWRVVAPFLRGYAPSALADDGYQIGALAADAIAAHKALGGDDRAVLIGHDWGAIAAYAAAGHSPELFSSVVTIAVPPLPALKGSPATMLRQLRQSWYTIFQQVPWLSERSLSRLIPKLWADWSPGYDAREDIAHVLAALSGPVRRTAALRYYRAVAQPWRHRRVYRGEQRFWRAVPPQPVLYLQGARDGCIVPTFADRVLPLLAAGSSVVSLPAAGHFAHLEQPAQVNALIAAFIHA